jgi:hypothetical protein
MKCNHHVEGCGYLDLEYEIDRSCLAISCNRHIPENRNGLAIPSEGRMQNRANEPNGQVGSRRTVF